MLIYKTSPDSYLDNYPFDHNRWIYTPAKWWEWRYRGGEYRFAMKPGMYASGDEAIARLFNILLDQSNGDLDLVYTVKDRFPVDSPRHSQVYKFKFRSITDVIHFRLTYLD